MYHGNKARFRPKLFLVIWSVYIGHPPAPSLPLIQAGFSFFSTALGAVLKKEKPALGAAVL